MRAECSTSLCSVDTLSCSCFLLPTLLGRGGGEKEGRGELRGHGEPTMSCCQMWKCSSLADVTTVPPLKKLFRSTFSASVRKVAPDPPSRPFTAGVRL